MSLPPCDDRRGTWPVVGGVSWLGCATVPAAAEPTDLTARLGRFAELVRDSEHNLVSRRARAELDERHIPECLAFARMLPRGSARVLDLGSGGGFPGMVVALARPELDVHLLDATAKKTGFLTATARELGVEVVVHTGRAEELGRRPELARSFDVVTARAVAPLDRLVRWSMPFLREGGLLYAIKGERWAEELQAAVPAIARHGASVVATPDDVHRHADGDGGVTPRVVMLARLSGRG
jgi:16S rRNA (guanine527-N7)-methyltransferase